MSIGPFSRFPEQKNLEQEQPKIPALSTLFHSLALPPAGQKQREFSTQSRRTPSSSSSSFEKSIHEQYKRRLELEGAVLPRSGNDKRLLHPSLFSSNGPKNVVGPRNVELHPHKKTVSIPSFPSPNSLNSNNITSGSSSSSNGKKNNDTKKNVETNTASNYIRDSSSGSGGSNWNTVPPTRIPVGRMFPGEAPKTDNESLSFVPYLRPLQQQDTQSAKELQKLPSLQNLFAHFKATSPAYEINRSNPQQQQQQRRQQQQQQQQHSGFPSHSNVSQNFNGKNNNSQLTEESAGFFKPFPPLSSVHSYLPSSFLPSKHSQQQQQLSRQHEDSRYQQSMPVSHYHPYKQFSHPFNRDSTPHHVTIPQYATMSSENNSYIHHAGKNYSNERPYKGSFTSGNTTSIGGNIGIGTSSGTGLSADMTGLRIQQDPIADQETIMKKMKNLTQGGDGVTSQALRGEYHNLTSSDEEEEGGDIEERRRDSIVKHPRGFTTDSTGNGSRKGSGDRQRKSSRMGTEKSLGLSRPMIDVSVGDNGCKNETANNKNRSHHNIGSNMKERKKSQGNRKKVHYDQLSKLFIFTEAEAAHKLNISKSKLKRLKKKMNIQRWPFRRLQSLTKEIENVKQLIAVAHQTGEGQEAIEALYQRMQDLELTSQFIRANPNTITKYKNDSIIKMIRMAQKVAVHNLVNNCDENDEEMLTEETIKSIFSSSNANFVSKIKNQSSSPNDDDDRPNDSPTPPPSTTSSSSGISGTSGVSETSGTLSYPSPPPPSSTTTSSLVSMSNSNIETSEMDTSEDGFVKTEVDNKQAAVSKELAIVKRENVPADGKKAALSSGKLTFRTTTVTTTTTTTTTTVDDE